MSVTLFAAIGPKEDIHEQRVILPRDGEDSKFDENAPESEYDKNGLPPENPSYNPRTRFCCSYNAMNALVSEMGFTPGDDPIVCPLDMSPQEFHDKVWDYLADPSGPRRHAATAAHFLAFAALAIERGATRIYAV